MTPISGWEDNFNLPEQELIKLHETGHAKNVAGFLCLIAYCKNLGSVYNPSNSILTFEHLEAFYRIALEKITAVETQKALFTTNISNRKRSFENLKPFATKIINAFAVSGVDRQTLEVAKSINKKIQGVLLKNNDQTYPASQQSYDRKLEHFEALIEILAQNPVYNPNEEELKITSLQGKLRDMKTQNQNLMRSHDKYNEALTERNQTLYDPETGLVSVSKKVKQYIKSVFGANSEQYHQLVTIEFKVRKTTK